MRRPDACLLLMVDSSRIILVIRAGLLGVKMSAPQTPRRRIQKGVAGYQSRFPKGHSCKPPEHSCRWCGAGDTRAQGSFGGFVVYNWRQTHPIFHRGAFKSIKLLVIIQTFPILCILQFTSRRISLKLMSSGLLIIITIIVL